ncbi:MAG: nucleoside permease [Candidatus Hydrogenedentes bacterium]|nr:nucleoside permease [Candidatus Hydrogenedentota bacterium]
MDLTVRLKLSLMMFVQFFVWGCWYVTMGSYLGTGLGFSGAAIGAAYSTTALGAIISPFFVGMIADRFFSAERILGVLHLVGAVLMYLVTRITDQDIFFWVLLAYTLCYMPTLALVNAIAFYQMKDPAREFPGIRVVGTLSWIAAGLLITLLENLGSKGIEATVLPFKLAVGASLVMGLYSFVLPHTPPKSLGKKVTMRDVLGLDALALMKERSFLVFTLGSLLICIPLQFYYGSANLFLNELGMTGVAGKQTMGQMSEIFFLLVMPFFLVRLGVKYMLLVGMLAWVTRYFLFAFGGLDVSIIWMLYLGIILHGVCFDFFFVTGQIYVDKKAPKEIQANAQGFIALITYGIGMFIGTYVMGAVLAGNTFSAPGHLTVSQGPENSLTGSWTSGDTTTEPKDLQFLDGVLKFSRQVEYQGKPYSVTFEGRLEGDSIAGKVTGDMGDLPVSAKRAAADAPELAETAGIVGGWDFTAVHWWRSIWLVPAVMALVVMIGFALLFNEKNNRTKSAAAGES